MRTSSHGRFSLLAEHPEAKTMIEREALQTNATLKPAGETAGGDRDLHGEGSHAAGDLSTGVNETPRDGLASADHDGARATRSVGQ